MATIIYPSPVFGPVKSRRLGISLGINLLPGDGKVCTFDCLYCECGFNKERRAKSLLPTRQEVYTALEQKLRTMAHENVLPDVLTFAGNGEPTIHPDFAGIIDDAIALRDRYCPAARVSVLTNATRITRTDVFEALMKVDNNILKLDTVAPEYIAQLDRPTGKYELKDIVDTMKRFGQNAIIQTMFLKGCIDGTDLDNTKKEYVEPWIATLKEIGPREVMIYTIDRETPQKGLEKASRETLDCIAEKVRAQGIKVSVSY